MAIVLESMGATFENEDEFEEYFLPVDLDEVYNFALLINNRMDSFPLKISSRLCFPSLR